MYRISYISSSSTSFLCLLLKLGIGAWIGVLVQVGFGRGKSLIKKVRLKLSKTKYFSFIFQENFEKSSNFISSRSKIILVFFSLVKKKFGYLFVCERILIGIWVAKSLK